MRQSQLLRRRCTRPAFLIVFGFTILCCILWVGVAVNVDSRVMAQVLLALTFGIAVCSWTTALVWMRTGIPRGARTCKTCGYQVDPPDSGQPPKHRCPECGGDPITLELGWATVVMELISCVFILFAVLTVLMGLFLWGPLLQADW